MRANVLNDAALAKQSGQFAWLSVNSDNPINAAFLEKFPADGVPAFLLIDSSNEKAVINWYGTATAPQLVMLLDDGRRVLAGKGSGADALLARADQLNSQKKFSEAADFYDQALKSEPRDSPRRERIVESLVMAYSFGHNQKACTEAAAREAPTMARDRSFVNTVYFGLDCSSSETAELRSLEKLAEQGVKLKGVLGDDISGLYMVLSATYRRDKDEADATRIANAWVGFLKGEMSKASSPETRMGYGLQLVSAAVFLHKPELALAGLERAEHDLPNDYNPPVQLATLYREMGRYDDALQACDRAISRASGVAKLRVYLAKGRVLDKKGDKDGLRKTYSEGIEYGRTLPESSAKSYITVMQKKLDTVSGTH